jgi:hypothetical protein
VQIDVEIAMENGRSRASRCLNGRQSHDVLVKQIGMNTAVRAMLGRGAA